jgi:hypothetical protein
MPYTELVPAAALWEEHPTLYDCPTCGRPIRSDYVGTTQPEVLCMSLQGGVGHRLTWEEPPPPAEGEPEGEAPPA